MKKRQAGNNFTPARRPEPRSSEELSADFSTIDIGASERQVWLTEGNNGPVGAKNGRAAETIHQSGDQISIRAAHTELHQKSELAKLMSKAEERISKTQQMWGEASVQGWSFPPHGRDTESYHALRQGYFAVLRP